MDFDFRYTNNSYIYDSVTSSGATAILLMLKGFTADKLAFGRKHYMMEITDNATVFVICVFWL